MEALTPDAALTLRLQTFDWETTEVEVVTLAPDGTVSVGRAAATDPRGPALAITHVASAQTRRRARELAASPAFLALPKIVTDPSTTDGWVLLLELRVGEASRRFSFQNHVPAAAVPLIELLRAAGEVPTRDPRVQVR